MRVERGIEDICLDTAQTVKGLPEDASSKLAVYQNLRSTERYGYKDLTYYRFFKFFFFELSSRLRSVIIPKSHLKSKFNLISIRALSF